MTPHKISSRILKHFLKRSCCALLVLIWYLMQAQKSNTYLEGKIAKKKKSSNGVYDDVKDIFTKVNDEKHFVTFAR